MKARDFVVAAVGASLVVAASSASAGSLSAADITDPSTQFFDPENHAIYQVVNSPVTQSEALAASALATLDGIQGFLATPLDAQQNIFLYDLAVAHVTTGWDYRSIWLGGNDAAAPGVFKWVAGPKAGAQFWRGLSGGHGVPGIYEHMYAPYIQNENSACGIAGCWTNPNGTGSNALFEYAGAYTPTYWDDAYSSTTAVSTSSSPIASSDGMRNAYVIEFLGVPEPTSWTMMLVGLFGLGALCRRARRPAGELAA